MKLKTMQDEWRDYRNRCYPNSNEMPAHQNAELHQAFFAGALSAINKMTEDIAALPEKEAEVALAAMIKEVLEICEARVGVLKGRN